MAKKKTPSTPVGPSPAPPEMFAATLGDNGTVFKGAVLTQDQAEARRRIGEDVVVCGDNLAANRALAGLIERNANGVAKRCPPHLNAGRYALPHYQPDERPPSGHTFYETPHRKAI